MRKNVLKKVTSFFYKDFQWKLLSLALAFALWLVAFNVIDPYQTKTFTVTLAADNTNILTRDDISVLNMAALEKTEIEVTIRAKESDITSIGETPGSYIEAFIDMRNIVTEDVQSSDSPINFAAPVYVDIDRSLGAERTDVSPDTVNVQLDRYMAKSYNIQVNKIGEVAEGYELTSTESREKNVTLHAAKSVLDRVYEVRAVVDVMGAEGEVTAVANLTALEQGGDDITAEVEMNISETEVHAEVLPFKEVSLVVETSGVPAYNHAITSTSVSPQTVFVVGTREVLDETGVLKLPSPDLTGLTASIEETADIRQLLPSNLHLRQGEVSEATVVVNIEPVVSNEYAYPIDRLSASGYIGGDYGARIVNMETVPILVQGSASAMGKMNASLINAAFSLQGLELGEHEIELTVGLPDGIRLMNTPVINVEIYEIQPAENLNEATDTPEDFDAEQDSENPDAEDGIAVLGINALTGEIVRTQDASGDDPQPDPEETGIPEEDAPDSANPEEDAE